MPGNILATEMTVDKKTNKQTNNTVSAFIGVLILEDTLNSCEMIVS